MTKEEAKTSLINTKVYVAGKSAEIQKKLFELEFEWSDSIAVKVQYEDTPFLYLYEKGVTRGASMNEFSNHGNKEVTADYILGLTWEEEKPKFQPFDKVLIRDDDNDIWRPRVYLDCCNDIDGKCSWDQILPYEGNEHLAYTKNEPE